MIDLEASVRQFAAAFTALSGPQRQLALQAVERQLDDDSPLKRLLSSHKTLLLEWGASSLLYAASARPAAHPLRQVLSRWLEGNKGKAGVPWLRYLSGPEQLTRSEAVSSFRAHKDRGIGMAVAADGTAWTWGKDGRELFRWNLETGEQLAKARCGFEVGTAGIGPTGLLAAGSTYDECTIAVWNEAGKRVYRLEDENDKFYATVRWLPAAFGESLLVADGGLKFVELGKKPQTRWTYQRPQAPNLQALDQLAVLPRGEEALFLDITHETPVQLTAHIISLVDGSVSRSVGIQSRISSYFSGVLAVSPNGSLIAFAETSTGGPPVEAGVFVWDLADGSCKHHFAQDRRVLSVAFELDDIMWCGTKDGCILRCDIGAGTILALRTDAAEIRSVALWREFVIALCGDGRVQRFAKRECRYRPDELGQEEQVHHFLPIEGQNRCLLSDADILYEVTSDQPRRVLSRLDPRYNKIATTADGRGVVCAWQASNGKSGLQWLKWADGATGAAPNKGTVELPTHVQQLLVSPNGAVAYCSSDGTGVPLHYVAFDGSPPHHLQADFETDILRDACYCAETNQIACAYQSRAGRILLLNERGSAPSSRVIALDESDVIAVGAVGAKLLAISQAGTVAVFSLPHCVRCGSCLSVKSGAPPLQY